MAKQAAMESSLALALTRQSSFLGYLHVREAEGKITSERMLRVKQGSQVHGPGTQEQHKKRGEEAEGRKDHFALSRAGRLELSFI